MREREMGKTVRKMPHWAKVVPDAELEKYGAQSRRRVERVNKRVRVKMDGAFCSVLGAADPKSPRGYNTHDDVWGPHRKRKEKALTHRSLRRTAVIDTAGYSED